MVTIFGFCYALDEVDSANHFKIYSFQTENPHPIPIIENYAESFTNKIENDTKHGVLFTLFTCRFQESGIEIFRCVSDELESMTDSRLPM